VQVLGEEGLNSLRLFWQPGCSSCQRVKEYLTGAGLAFESVNVREQPSAIADLQRLGARSVPVVSHGDRFVYAQSLADVASFLGLLALPAPLPITAMLPRISRFLEIARREAAALPAALLELHWPGREDRALADLAWHVPMIAEATLQALRGGVLDYAWFERRPAANQRNPAALAAQADATAAHWQALLNTHAGTLPATVATYYGEQPLAAVLERTAWHMAQHLRQLQGWLVSQHCTPVAPLQPADLADLPLPEGL
jgi:glutaredoxin